MAEDEKRETRTFVSRLGCLPHVVASCSHERVGHPLAGLILY